MPREEAAEAVWPLLAKGLHLFPEGSHWASVGPLLRLVRFRHELPSCPVMRQPQGVVLVADKSRIPRGGEEDVAMTHRGGGIDGRETALWSEGLVLLTRGVLRRRGARGTMRGPCSSTRWYDYTVFCKQIFKSISVVSIGLISHHYQY